MSVPFLGTLSKQVTGNEFARAILHADKRRVADRFRVSICTPYRWAARGDRSLNIRNYDLRNRVFAFVSSRLGWGLP